MQQSENIGHKDLVGGAATALHSHAGGAGTPDVAYFRKTGTTRERWYTRPLTHTAQTTSGALTSGRMYAIPFVVPKTITIDRIAVNVTTLVASGLIRLGIYNNANGEPGTLLLDAGAVDSSTTGVKTITISQQLVGGYLYWLVMLPNNATNVVRAAAVAGMVDVLGSGSTLPTAAVTYLYIAQAYGVLPASFGMPTDGTGTSPLIFVRLSA